MRRDVPGAEERSNKLRAGMRIKSRRADAGFGGTETMDRHLTIQIVQERSRYSGSWRKASGVEIPAARITVARQTVGRIPAGCERILQQDLQSGKVRRLGEEVGRSLPHRRLRIVHR